MALANPSGLYSFPALPLFFFNGPAAAPIGQYLQLRELRRACALDAAARAAGKSSRSKTRGFAARGFLHPTTALALWRPVAAGSDFCCWLLALRALLCLLSSLKTRGFAALTLWRRRLWLWLWPLAAGSDFCCWLLACLLPFCFGFWPLIEPLALSGPLALALCLRLAASSGFGCWLSGLVLCLRLAASAAAVAHAGSCGIIAPLLLLLAMPWLPLLLAALALAAGFGFASFWYAMALACCLLRGSASALAASAALLALPLCLCSSSGGCFGFASGWLSGSGFSALWLRGSGSAALPQLCCFLY